MATLEPHQTAITAMRLRAAFACAQALPETLEHVANDWLAGLSNPTSPSIDRLAFGAALDAGLDRVFLEAVGPTTEFRLVVEDTLGGGDAAAREATRLDALCRLVEPALVGHWIEVSTGVDHGWSFPVSIPLDHARSSARSSEASFLLGDWAARNGLVSCSRLAGSVSMGNPATELRIPLDAAGNPVAVGLDLVAALSLPAPDASLAATLAELARPGIELSIRLTARGVSRASLLYPGTTSDELVRLCAAAGTPDAGGLAIFEAALDVEHRTFAECALSARGWTVTGRYEGLVAKRDR